MNQFDHLQTNWEAKLDMLMTDTVSFLQYWSYNDSDQSIWVSDIIQTTQWRRPYVEDL